MLEIADNLYY